MGKRKTPAPAKLRAGFVAIVGRPNVGKSTLLNRVLGEKVAIVSPRPQTTRTRILGVHTAPGMQIAFFDTPGLHRAKGALNSRMVETALATLSEVDTVLVLVEAGTGPGGRVEVGEATQWILEQVKRSGKPLVLGVSKADRAPKETLLPVIAAYQGLAPWSDVVPFSSFSGENVEDLLATLAKTLPESEALLFPDDMLTDQAERQLAAEYVREQVILQTRQELPYAVAVEVEEFDESARHEGKSGLVRISALLLVERDSQKAILIGKRGEMLKSIGTRAREGLDRLLGCKVFLKLTVKVEARWSERAASLQKLGL
ncbi:MAG TPA: GTPase Era [Anaeromyxobacteraceae bacterium]|nr:GTPase Era [Anaeromyxobacteraceae bacterium]